MTSRPMKNISYEFAYFEQDWNKVPMTMNTLLSNIVLFRPNFEVMAPPTKQPTMAKRVQIATHEDQNQVSPVSEKGSPLLSVLARLKKSLMCS